MLDPLNDFLRHTQAPKWSIEGVIAEGELNMLFGEPGAGKSFTALDFALCIATGTPWMGHEVSQGPVVYLPSEGFEGFRARIRAWCSHRNIAADNIPLFMGAYEMALNDPADYAEVENDLGAIRPDPRLIVIDTLTGMTKGLDQNFAKEMAAFADTCKALKDLTGAAILVVHHSGHKDKGRSKGAVDFWAACDRVIGVKRSGQCGALALTCAKSRNGPPFEDIHVKLEQCEPAAVLVEADKPVNTEGSTLNRGDRIFREVIGDEPIDTAEAKSAFYEKYGKSPGANRNAWSRAFEKAVNAGYVETAANGLISPNTHTPHK